MRDAYESFSFWTLHSTTPWYLLPKVTGPGKTYGNPCRGIGWMIAYVSCQRSPLVSQVPVTGIFVQYTTLLQADYLGNGKHIGSGRQLQLSATDSPL